jgi:hypothetical protein
VRQTAERLQQIGDELSQIAGVFEARGFNEERHLLDQAGEFLDRFIEDCEMRDEMDGEVAALKPKRKTQKRAEPRPQAKNLTRKRLTP